MPALCETCGTTCHPERTGLHVPYGEPLCKRCALAIVGDAACRPAMADRDDAEDYQRRVVVPIARLLGRPAAPPSWRGED